MTDPKARTLTVRLDHLPSQIAVETMLSHMRALLDNMRGSRDKNCALHFRLCPAGFIKALNVSIPPPLHDAAHRDGLIRQVFTGEGWRVEFRLINATVHNALNPDKPDQQEETN